MRHSIFSRIIGSFACILFTASASFVVGQGTTTNYWPFDTDFDADVGSVDAVGGVNVTLATLDGRAAAVVPQSVGGPDDHIGLSAHIAGFGADPFSISLWFNGDPGDVNPGTGNLFARGILDFSADGDEGPQILFDAMGRLRGRLDLGPGTTNAGVAGNITGLDNGLWHFAVLTYDPTSGVSLIIDNGSPEFAALSGAAMDWATDQYMGTFNFNGTTENKGLDGGLDDVALYAGILNSTQIADLFSGATTPADYADADCLLGDVNMSGSVTLTDVAPFVNVLTSGGFQCEADIDQNGSVTLLDVAPFVAILTGGG